MENPPKGWGSENSKCIESGPAKGNFQASSHSGIHMGEFCDNIQRVPLSPIRKEKNCRAKRISARLTGYGPDEGASPKSRVFAKLFCKVKTYPPLSDGAGNDPLKKQKGGSLTKADQNLGIQSPFSAGYSECVLAAPNLDKVLRPGHTALSPQVTVAPRAKKSSRTQANLSSSFDLSISW